MKANDVIISVMILGIVLAIILPIGTFLLDVLLIINIALSLMILLTNLYIKRALEFSTFPTMLLFLTLFRISLNIASTKLILGNNGDAGKVIETFGNFVVGNNLVVGFVVFLIIIIVQFLIITKGSERVAEVAARFTLDAMPGKQMAIDADLNSGVVSETEAKQRRDDIQREANFYGAMDGASKFVKGDAIVGIIIVLINTVGGLLIGVVGIGGGAGMDINQALEVYVLAVVGDGLVSQIPALLVSTATGVIVTRSASQNSFGQEVSKQLFARPAILFVLGGLLFLFAFIPGLPKVPIFMLAIGLPLAAYFTLNSRKKKEISEQEDTAEIAAKEKRKPESVTSLLNVDTIEMEFGYGIISMVDTSQGGDLLDRVVMIRRQCALDLGIIVPVVRLRDNIQLKNNQYSIKIKGLEVASGEVMIDHYLALKPADVKSEVKGIETVDPTFGMPAVWVTETNREEAELKGYTTIDAPSVISTHLVEIIKRHAHEILGRQQVKTLIDNLKTQQPALVEEVVPKLFSIGEIQKVLANLLKEGISIRDIGTIIEILGDYGTIVRDPETLTEYVRQNLKRAITHKFIPDGKARVITLDPALEHQIAENIHKSEQGSYAVLEPAVIQKILVSLKTAVEHFLSLGITPIVLTTPQIRKDFKRLSLQLDPDITVLSYNEIEQHVEIYSDKVVKI